MKIEKRIGKTPNGGDYSEMCIFDDEIPEMIDRIKYYRCMIRECKNNGEIVSELYSCCKAD